MDEAEKPKKKVAKAKPAATAKPKAKAAKKPLLNEPHDPHAEITGFIRNWKTA